MGFIGEEVPPEGWPTSKEVGPGLSDHLVAGSWTEADSGIGNVTDGRGPRL